MADKSVSPFLSDCTDGSLHVSCIGSNNTTSTWSSLENESVLDNMSQVSIERLQREISFMERVRAASDLSNHSRIFSRGILNKFKFKKKKKRGSDDSLMSNSDASISIQALDRTNPSNSLSESSNITSGKELNSAKSTRLEPSSNSSSFEKIHHKQSTPLSKEVSVLFESENENISNELLNLSSSNMNSPALKDIQANNLNSRHKKKRIVDKRVSVGYLDGKENVDLSSDLSSFNDSSLDKSQNLGLTRRKTALKKIAKPKISVHFDLNNSVDDNTNFKMPRKSIRHSKTASRTSSELQTNDQAERSMEMSSNEADRNKPETVVVRQTRKRSRDGNIRKSRPPQPNSQVKEAAASATDDQEASVGSIDQSVGNYTSDIPSNDLDNKSDIDGILKSVEKVSELVTRVTRKKTSVHLNFNDSSDGSSVNTNSFKSVSNRNKKEKMQKKKKCNSLQSDLINASENISSNLDNLKSFSEKCIASLPTENSTLAVRDATVDFSNDVCRNDNDSTSHGANISGLMKKGSASRVNVFRRVASLGEDNDANIEDRVDDSSNSNTGLIAPMDITENNICTGSGINVNKPVQNINQSLEASCISNMDITVCSNKDSLNHVAGKKKLDCQSLNISGSLETDINNDSVQDQSELHLRKIRASVHIPLENSFDAESCNPGNKKTLNDSNMDMTVCLKTESLNCEMKKRKASVHFDFDTTIENTESIEESHKSVLSQNKQISSPSTVDCHSNVSLGNELVDKECTVNLNISEISGTPNTDNKFDSTSNCKSQNDVDCNNQCRTAEILPENVDNDCSSGSINSTVTSSSTDYLLAQVSSCTSIGDITNLDISGISRCTTGRKSSKCRGIKDLTSKKESVDETDVKGCSFNLDCESLNTSRSPEMSVNIDISNEIGNNQCELNLSKNKDSVHIPIENSFNVESSTPGDKKSINNSSIDMSMCLMADTSEHMGAGRKASVHFDFDSSSENEESPQELLKPVLHQNKRKSSLAMNNEELSVRSRSSNQTTVSFESSSVVKRLTDANEISKTSNQINELESTSNCMPQNDVEYDIESCSTEISRKVSTVSLSSAINCTVSSVSTDYLLSQLGNVSNCTSIGDISNLDISGISRSTSRKSSISSRVKESISRKKSMDRKSLNIRGSSELTGCVDVDVNDESSDDQTESKFNKNKASVHMPIENSFNVESSTPENKNLIASSNMHSCGSSVNSNNENSNIRLRRASSTQNTQISDGLTCKEESKHSAGILLESEHAAISTIVSEGANSDLQDKAGKKRRSVRFSFNNPVEQKNTTKPRKSILRKSTRNSSVIQSCEVDPKAVVDSNIISYKEECAIKENPLEEELAVRDSHSTKKQLEPEFKKSVNSPVNVECKNVTDLSKENKSISDTNKLSSLGETKAKKSASSTQVKKSKRKHSAKESYEIDAVKTLVSEQPDNVKEVNVLDENEHNKKSTCSSNSDLNVMPNGSEDLGIEDKRKSNTITTFRDKSCAHKAKESIGNTLYESSMDFTSVSNISDKLVDMELTRVPTQSNATEEMSFCKVTFEDVRNSPKPQELAHTFSVEDELCNTSTNNSLQVSNMEIVSDKHTDSLKSEMSERSNVIKQVSDKNVEDNCPNGSLLNKCLDKKNQFDIDTKRDTEMIGVNKADACQGPSEKSMFPVENHLNLEISCNINRRSAPIEFLASASQNLIKNSPICSSDMQTSHIQKSSDSSLLAKMDSSSNCINETMDMTSIMVSADSTDADNLSSKHECSRGNDSSQMDFTTVHGEGSMESECGVKESISGSLEVLENSKNTENRKTLLCENASPTNVCSTDIQEQSIDLAESNKSLNNETEVVGNILAECEVDVDTIPDSNNCVAIFDENNHIDNHKLMDNVSSLSARLDEGSVREPLVDASVSISVNNAYDCMKENSLLLVESDVVESFNSAHPTSSKPSLNKERSNRNIKNRTINESGDSLSTTLMLSDIEGLSRCDISSMSSFIDSNDNSLANIDKNKLSEQSTTEGKTSIISEYDCSISELKSLKKSPTSTVLHIKRDKNSESINDEVIKGNVDLEEEESKTDTSDKLKSSGSLTCKTSLPNLNMLPKKSNDDEQNGSCSEASINSRSRENHHSTQPLRVTTLVNKTNCSFNATDESPSTSVMLAELGTHPQYNTLSLTGADDSTINSIINRDENKSNLMTVAKRKASVLIGFDSELSMLPTNETRVNVNIDGNTAPKDIVNVDDEPKEILKLGKLSYTELPSEGEITTSVTSNISCEKLNNTSETSPMSKSTNICSLRTQTSSLNVSVRKVQYNDSQNVSGLTDVSCASLSTTRMISELGDLSQNDVSNLSSIAESTGNTLICDDINKSYEKPITKRRTSVQFDFDCTESEICIPEKSSLSRSSPSDESNISGNMDDKLISSERSTEIKKIESQNLKNNSSVDAPDICVSSAKDTSKQNNSSITSILSCSATISKGNSLASKSSPHSNEDISADNKTSIRQHLIEARGSSKSNNRFNRQHLSDLNLMEDSLRTEFSFPNSTLGSETNYSKREVGKRNMSVHFDFDDSTDNSKIRHSKIQSSVSDDINVQKHDSSIDSSNNTGHGNFNQLPVTSSELNILGRGQVGKQGSEGIKEKVQPNVSLSNGPSNESFTLKLSQSQNLSISNSGLLQEGASLTSCFKKAGKRKTSVHFDFDDSDDNVVIPRAKKSILTNSRIKVPAESTDEKLTHQETVNSNLNKDKCFEEVSINDSLQCGTKENIDSKEINISAVVSEEQQGELSAIQHESASETAVINYRERNTSERNGSGSCQLDSYLDKDKTIPKPRKSILRGCTSKSSVVENLSDEEIDKKQIIESETHSSNKYDKSTSQLVDNEMSGSKLKVPNHNNSYGFGSYEVARKENSSKISRSLHSTITSNESGASTAKLQSRVGAEVSTDGTAEEAQLSYKEEDDISFPDVADRSVSSISCSGSPSHSPNLSSIPVEKSFSETENTSFVEGRPEDSIVGSTINSCIEFCPKDVLTSTRVADGSVQFSITDSEITENNITEICNEDKINELPNFTQNCDLKKRVSVQLGFETSHNFTSSSLGDGTSLESTLKNRCDTNNSKQSSLSNTSESSCKEVMNSTNSSDSSNSVKRSVAHKRVSVDLSLDNSECQKVNGISVSGCNVFPGNSNEANNSSLPSVETLSLIQKETSIKLGDNLFPAGPNCLDNDSVPSLEQPSNMLSNSSSELCKDTGNTPGSAHTSSRHDSEQSLLPIGKSDNYSSMSDKHSQEVIKDEERTITNSSSYESNLSTNTNEMSNGCSTSANDYSEVNEQLEKTTHKNKVVDGFVSIEKITNADDEKMLNPADDIRNVELKTAFNGKTLSEWEVLENVLQKTETHIKSDRGVEIHSGHTSAASTLSFNENQSFMPGEKTNNGSSIQEARSEALDESNKGSFTNSFCDELDYSEDGNETTNRYSASPDNCSRFKSVFRNGTMEGKIADNRISDLLESKQTSCSVEGLNKTDYILADDTCSNGFRTQGQLESIKVSDEQNLSPLADSINSEEYGNNYEEIHSNSVQLDKYVPESINDGTLSKNASVTKSRNETFSGSSSCTKDLKSVFRPGSTNDNNINISENPPGVSVHINFDSSSKTLMSGTSLLKSTIIDPESASDKFSDVSEGNAVQNRPQSVSVNIGFDTTISRSDENIADKDSVMTDVLSQSTINNLDKSKTIKSAKGNSQTEFNEQFIPKNVSVNIGLNETEADIDKTIVNDFTNHGTTVSREEQIEHSDCTLVDGTSDNWKNPGVVSVPIGFESTDNHSDFNKIFDSGNSENSITSKYSKLLGNNVMKNVSVKVAFDSTIHHTGFEQITKTPDSICKNVSTGYTSCNIANEIELTNKGKNLFSEFNANKVNAARNVSVHIDFDTTNGQSNLCLKSQLFGNSAAIAEHEKENFKPALASFASRCNSDFLENPESPAKHVDFKSNAPNLKPDSINEISTTDVCNHCKSVEGNCGELKSLHVTNTSKNSEHYMATHVECDTTTNTEDQVDEVPTSSNSPQPTIHESQFPEQCPKTSLVVQPISPASVKDTTDKSVRIKDTVQSVSSCAKLQGRVTVHESSVETTVTEHRTHSEYLENEKGGDLQKIETRADMLSKMDESAEIIPVVNDKESDDEILDNGHNLSCFSPTSEPPKWEAISEQLKLNASSPECLHLSVVSLAERESVNPDVSDPLLNDVQYKLNLESKASENKRNLPRGFNIAGHSMIETNNAVLHDQNKACEHSKNFSSTVDNSISKSSTKRRQFTNSDISNLKPEKERISRNCLRKSFNLSSEIKPDSAKSGIADTGSPTVTGESKLYHNTLETPLKNHVASQGTEENLEKSQMNSIKESKNIVEINEISNLNVKNKSFPNSNEKSLNVSPFLQKSAEHIHNFSENTSKDCSFKKKRDLETSLVNILNESKKNADNNNASSAEVIKRKTVKANSKSTGVSPLLERPTASDRNSSGNSSKEYNLRKRKNLSSASDDNQKELVRSAKRVTFSLISPESLSSSVKNKKTKSQETSTSPPSATSNVFVCPKVPLQRQSDGTTSSAKKSKNSVGEQTDDSSLMKRKIDDLSKDLLLDVSEIPRDRAVASKKVIYHSTPIPNLEKRHSNRISKRSFATSANLPSVTTFESSDNTKGLSKLSTSSSHSRQARSKNKRKRSDKENVFTKPGIKAKICSRIEEDEPSEEYKENVIPESSYTSSTPPTYSSTHVSRTVKFKQKVQFRSLSSEEVSTSHNPSLELRDTSDRRVYRQNKSGLMLSSLVSSSENTSNLSEIPKKVLFREISSHINGSSEWSSRSENPFITPDQTLRHNNYYNSFSSRSTEMSTGNKYPEQFSSTNNTPFSVTNSENHTPSVSSIGRLTNDIDDVSVSTEAFDSLHDRIDRSGDAVFKKPLRPARKKVPKRVKYDFKNDERFLVDGKLCFSEKLVFPQAWVSVDLYKFLCGKLETNYGIKASGMAQSLIEHLCASVSAVERFNKEKDINLSTLVLRNLLSKYKVCSDMLHYCTFITRYTPLSFQRKVLPMGGYFGSEAMTFTGSLSDPFITETENLDVDL